MTATKIAEEISLGLMKIRERAKRDPKGQLRSLAHLLDTEALKRAYGRIRKDAAVGVDGVTKEQYGKNLEENLRNLHQRMKEMKWRHQPILRVHIPKSQGKTRPIGISSMEDKIVQEALREVLEMIYEPMFSEVSYGFRPGRGAHDALRTLDSALMRGEISWVLEADIQSFFDSIDRKMLMEMLRERIADENFTRLIGKCLHVGVLEGTETSEPESGTVQGSVISPLLGNIYLHQVLDTWFEAEVRPRMAGRVMLVRYADDFVLGFEREDDARRVMKVIGKRFERYGLKLHPDKTRLIPFERPASGQTGGKGPSTFDFLGFTVYWRRSRWGRWVPALKTRRVRLRQAIKSVMEWCRRHRHQTVKEQQATLKRKLAGHYNYFGVNGNMRSLGKLFWRVRRVWHYWLSRRSQRARMSWERFEGVWQRYPLPSPRICVQLWSTSP